MRSETDLKQYPAPLTVDLNEGRSVEMGCLFCKETGDAYLRYTKRPYIISLDCEHCGDVLVTWDQFMGVTRIWRAA